MAINVVNIAGRACADPEEKGDKAVALRIAADRERKGSKGEVVSDYHDLIAFDKNADFIKKYVKKGTSLFVTGSIRDNNYTDKEGNKVYSKQFVIDKISFASGESFCQAIIGGNLTKEPEVRYSTGERSMAIARYTIAVNRGKDKDGKEQTDYVDCTSFGKTAENIEKYMKKGSPMTCIGEIQNESWTDKEGKKRTSTRLVSSRVIFGSKKEDCENAGGDNSSAGKQEASKYDFDFMNVTDDMEELPFK